MTGANLLIFTRYLLQEKDEAFWLTTNLLLSLNAALYKWAALLNKSSNNYYLKSASLSLTASTNYVAVPNDFAGTCYIVEDNGNGYKPLGKVPFSEIDPSASGNPKNICLTKAYVWFDSKPLSARTYTIQYPGKPTAIANDTTEVDFPTFHHALLAYEAAIIGRIRDKTSDITFLLQERDKLAATFIEELGDNITGISTLVRDTWPIDANGE